MYVGMTNNLKLRLQQHQSKQNKTKDLQKNIMFINWYTLKK
ncbi:GIY-YIG nuclease family protein [Croceitalea sp. MTPC5]